MRLLRISPEGEPVFTRDFIHDKDEIPPYAILSHTWSNDHDQEVTYKDIKKQRHAQKSGYCKIQFCAERAKHDDLEHFWIDTCCIDKTNAAELTESINSMYRWYQNAQKCYVYLADVFQSNGQLDDSAPSRWKSEFRKSRWFTRGWTLQELIAPTVVEFFSAEGLLLGNRASLEQTIHEITHVPLRILQGAPLDEFDNQVRMSWSNGRVTSRGEDKAYCLLGILGITMPSNYGEGEEGAFKRLNRVISTDQGGLVEDAQLTASIDQCLADLRISDPRDDKSRIESTKGGLLEDSYRWILNHHDFRQWRHDQDSSLLWIKGDPGKGKTMLLCGITDELTRSSTNKCLVSYFFCQATDRNLNNATAILRGLIYMLVRQDRSLAKHLHEEWKLAGLRLFEDVNAWDALARILTAMLQNCQSGKLVFIIDALDECLLEDLPKLLNFIIKQSQDGGEVKWLVSSRNWPEIEDLFSIANQKVRLSLELNKDSISAAVGAYIRYKADRLQLTKGIDDLKRNEVIKYMESHADDTFLWVALVYQRLQNSTIRARHILSELGRFPPGLNALYQRMMGFIDTSLDAKLCCDILSTVSITYRPISITELHSLIESECPADPIELREIIGSCGSFLTIREDTIYFVHQSAKEFLTTMAANHVFPPGGIISKHRSLSEMSLKVLSKSLQKDVYNLQDPGVSIRDIRPPSPDPLAPLRYCCIFWVDHIADGGFYDNRQSWRDTVQAVDDFLHQQHLYWLEALSLLGAIGSGLLSLTTLAHLIEERNELKQLKEFIFDAIRFSKYNGAVIAQYPLQTYVAALVFSPMTSLVRKAFRQEEPAWLALKSCVRMRWSAHLQTLEGHTDFVNTVAFSHDSRLVASASDDKTVRIWDTETGEEWQVLQGHTSFVNSVMFSHDSRLVASASADKTVRIWDAKTGEEWQVLQGHTGTVISVTFSHDSRLVASASRDKTVRIWDAETGEERQVLQGHTSEVNSVMFSHDSRLVASASRDGTVRIWDAETGAQRQTLKTGYVSQIRFDLSGTQLLTDVGAFPIVSMNESAPVRGHDKVPHDLPMKDVLVSPNLPRVGYGISQDRRWLTLGVKNILWLPSEYRPVESAISGDTVVIGCSSGKVLFMRLRY